MPLKHRCILFLAKGFGAGSIPVAPGTFGSVVGLGWFAVLLLAQQWWVFFVGIAASVAASVWLCGQGELLLGRKDPGPVVMDEIIAIPICFVSWMALTYGRVPSPEECFASHWIWVIAIFGLFRFFDVAKPWPVRQSQSLPGGWGITIDDVLAAVYVNIVVLLVWAIRPALFSA